MAVVLRLEGRAGRGGLVCFVLTIIICRLLSLDITSSLNDLTTTYFASPFFYCTYNQQTLYLVDTCRLFHDQLLYFITVELYLRVSFQAPPLRLYIIISVVVGTFY